MRNLVVSRDAREQTGIIGELGGVLQGQPLGSRAISRNDQRSDLDELTIAPGRPTGVPPRA
jgi:hypothetical protein